MNRFNLSSLTKIKCMFEIIAKNSEFACPRSGYVDSAFWDVSEIFNGS